MSNKNYCLIIIIIACATLLSFCLSASAETKTDYPITEQDKSFVRRLKHSIEIHDEQWVVDNVAMPINVKIYGQKIKINSKHEFIKNYDKIINVNVKNAVLTQDENHLFANWQGIMIGQGQIWIGLPCADSQCKIIEPFIRAINN